MPGLPIKEDVSPAELRRLARREGDGRVGRRFLAIANALDGMSREMAARAAGMDRQTLRDWVIRYNRGGTVALFDAWGDGRPCRLTEGQQATLRALILAGPDPAVNGVSSWRVVDLSGSCRSGSASVIPRVAWQSCCATCSSRPHTSGPPLGSRN